VAALRGAFGAADGRGLPQMVAVHSFELLFGASCRHSAREMPARLPAALLVQRGSVATGEKYLATYPTHVQQGVSVAGPSTKAISDGF